MKEEAKVNESMVIEVINHCFGVDVKDNIKSRKGDIIYPRQLCQYFLYKYVNMSYPKIAEVFNLKSHATVMHNVKVKIGMLYDIGDSKIVEDVNKISALLIPYHFPIYISGKITGLDYDEAFDAFETRHKYLSTMGFKNVINPMYEIKKGAHTYMNYLSKSAALLSKCGSIYMMRGWHKSKGAIFELRLAKLWNLKIIYENDK